MHNIGIIGILVLLKFEKYQEVISHSSGSLNLT